MIKYLKLLRIQALAIFLTAILAGLAGKQNILDISIATLTLFFITLGLWAIDDYVDRDYDKIVHPKRVIASGLLNSHAVLRIGILSLATAIGISSVKICAEGDFALSAMTLIYIVLGLVAINIHKIIRTFSMQTIFKMVIVATLIGLVFPTAGGFSVKIIVLALIVSFFNLGSTIILDYMDSLTQKSYPTQLMHASGTIYLLSGLIVWVPYLLGTFNGICIIPIFGLSLCAVVLSIFCFTRKVDKKVKVVSALGSLFVFWILIIWISVP